MQLSSIIHYMPPGITPAGTSDWESHLNDPANSWLGDRYFATECPLADAALARYVEALEGRFVSGGIFDTRIIPTGQEFMEIVCGHPFNGRGLCKVYSPLLAVQLFIDAVERYVAQGRTSGTIYWRVYPALRGVTSQLETWDKDMQAQHKWEETHYAVRSRLLIV